MRRVISNVLVLVSLGFFTLDAAAQGSTTYYFPHLAVGASWQTTITYINYSSQEVSCTTEFLSDQGSPLLVSFPTKGTDISRDDVLPPGGSVHEETDVDLSAPLVPGWARAACSGPVKASLLFRQYDSEGVPTGEAGVNAAAVPATRFVTFAEQREGKAGTGVAYANPSAMAAHVTLMARDAAGLPLASVVRTLLPGGHDAHSMADLFGLPSFSGSLEVTSTEPIVSLSLNFEADPVFSSLPPGDDRDDTAASVSRDAPNNTKNSGIVVVSGDSQRWGVDEYVLNDATIAGDTLTLNVSYGGGCEAHQFTLVVSDSFMESFPVQLAVSLAHNGNGDSCEAWLTKDYEFDLGIVKERYRKAYRQETGTVILLLDDVPAGQLVYEFVM